MKKKNFYLLAATALFTVAFFNPVQAYNYGYSGYYGYYTDSPGVRSIDNNFNTGASVEGYAQAPQSQADYDDPYHQQMESKARKLNLMKMDNAINNVERQDRADGRRETRDKMYTGREGLRTVDTTTNSVRNIHSLIRSFGR